MGRAAQSPSVLLADDHPLVRLAVREDLESAGFRVCAEASSAEEAIAAAERERPDLCLLDVSMPGGGLGAARAIVERVPGAAVVMLSTSTSEEDFLEAVRWGAQGYLLKEDDPGRLPAALRDVLAGIPAFPRRLTGPVLTAARRALEAADRD